eukprot:5573901-Prymnesium_polylepis.1
MPCAPVPGRGPRATRHLSTCSARCGVATWFLTYGTQFLTYGTQPDSMQHSKWGGVIDVN